MIDQESDKNFHCETKLLLDTHVLIWYAEGINLSVAQVEEIEKHRKVGNVFISRISMWEIAMLFNKGRLSLSFPLQEWVNKLTEIEGLNTTDLTTEILIESCQLPNYTHKDPIDRMIIATARCLNATLMTMDKKISEYSENGYVKVLDLRVASTH